MLHRFLISGAQDGFSGFEESRWIVCGIANEEFRQKKRRILDDDEYKLGVDVEVEVLEEAESLSQGTTKGKNRLSVD